ncbi:MAG TPA: hypothetical protein VGM06_01835 [Polyangiaceae bacterium]|jgi:hypothetical protein
MQASVVTFTEDETPTKPINDGPTLMRIRRIAALARERLTVDPDPETVALAATELQAIESLAEGALR